MFFLIFFFNENKCMYVSEISKRKTIGKTSSLNYIEILQKYNKNEILIK